MRRRHSLLTPVAFAVAAFALSACGGGLGGKTRTEQDLMKDKEYQFGSLLSEEGGTTLFGGKSKKDDDGTGLGVNAFLWRAALDTLSFMPIVSADPFGGVILTDWHAPPESPGERFKVNLYILDKQLRADGLRIAVFRQVRAGNEWREAAVTPDTARKLEDSVLTRARQLRIAQSTGQAAGK